jgi:hypothetical protein
VSVYTDPLAVVRPSHITSPGNCERCRRSAECAAGQSVYRLHGYLPMACESIIATEVDPDLRGGLGNNGAYSRRRGTVIERVGLYLRDHPAGATRRKIADALAAGQNTVNDAVAELCREGQVVDTGRRYRKASIYAWCGENGGKT